MASAFPYSPGHSSHSIVLFSVTELDFDFPASEMKIVACIRAANKILCSGYEADKNRELRWWFGGVVVVALGIRGPDVCTFPEPPVVGKVVQVDTPTNSP